MYGFSYGFVVCCYIVWGRSSDAVNGYWYASFGRFDAMVSDLAAVFIGRFMVCYWLIQFRTSDLNGRIK